MNWKKLLESLSESVNNHLRLRNDYLVAENRILRNQINGRVQLIDNERKALAEIGAQLGKKTLAQIATIATPDTVLAWHRKFADQKGAPCEPPKSVGRPRVDQEIEDLVIRMARENRSWGYDRIQGALYHLGYTISDQTVGNILKRHGISPAPERKKTLTWREFTRSHLDVLLATDFFNNATWDWLGYVISCLLGFIYVGGHHAHSMGMTLPRQTLMVGFFRHYTPNRHAPRKRWDRWSKTCIRSGAIRWGEGCPCNPIAEFSLDRGRQPRIPDMGQVVLMPAGRPRPIRDAPMRSRQPLPELRKADDREAA